MKYFVEKNSYYGETGTKILSPRENFKIWTIWMYALTLSGKVEGALNVYFKTNPITSMEYTICAWTTKVFGSISLLTITFLSLKMVKMWSQLLAMWSHQNQTILSYGLFFSRKESPKCMLAMRLWWMILSRALYNSSQG